MPANTFRPFTGPLNATFDSLDDAYGYQLGEEIWIDRELLLLHHTDLPDYVPGCTIVLYKNSHGSALAAGMAVYHKLSVGQWCAEKTTTARPKGAFIGITLSAPADGYFAFAVREGFARALIGVGAATQYQSVENDGTTAGAVRDMQAGNEDHVIGMFLEAGLSTETQDMFVQGI